MFNATKSMAQYKFLMIEIAKQKKKNDRNVKHVLKTLIIKFRTLLLIKIKCQFACQTTNLLNINTSNTVTSSKTKGRTKTADVILLYKVVHHLIAVPVQYLPVDALIHQGN